MKPIRCDLPYADKIEIVTFADEHIGDKNSDWKHLKERIEYVEQTDNCYCVLNGDLIDAAIANSVGDIYGAEMQPMEALKLCVKTFGGIASKTLCVLPGNHEHRIYKSTGIDIVELMAAQLRISISTSIYPLSCWGIDVKYHLHGAAQLDSPMVHLNIASAWSKAVRRFLIYGAVSITGTADDC